MICMLWILPEAYIPNINVGWKPVITSEHTALSAVLALHFCEQNNLIPPDSEVTNRMKKKVYTEEFWEQRKVGLLWIYALYGGGN